MQIGVPETSGEASVAAARSIVDLLVRKSNATLGVVTGSTPEGLYSESRGAHVVGRSALEDSATLALDEYVGIADDHPEKYRNVLQCEFVGPEKTGLVEAGLRIPVSSDVDPHLVTEQYEMSIATAGGADLQILGIGVDGHTGSNEPSGSSVSRARVEVPSRRTRMDNACLFDGNAGKVPSRCIMQGLGMIMEARSLSLLVFGTQEVEAVRQLIGGVTNARWPVTVAQMYPDLIVFVDAEAAELLEYVDLYRKCWNLA